MFSRVNAINKTSAIVYFVIFLFLLAEMRCWIGFGLTRLYTFSFPVIMVLLGLLGEVRYEFKRKYVVYSLIVLFFSLYNAKAWSMNLSGILYFSVVAVNLLFVLSIPDSDKESLLCYIIKCFGLILIPGLVIYFITLIFPISSFWKIIPRYGDTTLVTEVYNNFIFLIQPTVITGSFPRFNGTFIESGDLGCASAFLLFAARFDFKKYKYLNVILVALIVSLSLAGWAMCVIGYILILYSQNRLRLSASVAIVISFLIIYLFGIYYNGGNNIIYNSILSRLEYDETYGFAGNNRASWLATQYYLEMLNNPQLLWNGYDLNTYNYIVENGGSVGAGYVSTVIRIGLIGIIGLVLPYFYIALTSTNKRYAWSFFVIFIMYMFQRCDSTWMVFVISYVYGIQLSKNNK